MDSKCLRVYGTLAQDVDFETMNHLGCYPYYILIIELLLKRSRESLRSHCAGAVLNEF